MNREKMYLHFPKICKPAGEVLVGETGRKDIVAEDIRFDITGERKGRPVRLSGAAANQFDAAGRWLKGNLHCHLARPGNPEWLNGAAENYHGLGYDFIAGMDHNKIVSVTPPEGLLIVPGAEISGPGHFLAFGIDELPGPAGPGGSTFRTAAMIGKVRESGGITVLAHPFKNGYTWKELNLFCDAGLDGFEVVNSNARGKGADVGRADQLWHQLLREGRHLVPTGGDDSHGFQETMNFKGRKGVSHTAWTGVLVETVSAEGILNAIRKGRTYASENPEIHGIKFNSEGKLSVTCSPCVACHFRSVGGTYGGCSAYPSQGESSATNFVLDLSEKGYRVQDYIVIVLQDAFGRRAWASPLKINVQIREL